MLTPYYAVTAGEKAKAKRLEARGEVKITRELDTYIKHVGRVGRSQIRLISREIFYVETVGKDMAV